MCTHGTTTSTSDDGFRRVEVITGVGRRRRWTDEEKAWIVAESLDPATTTSAVARRYGLHPSRLFVWRQQLAASAARDAPGFVPVLVTGEGTTPAEPGGRIAIVLGPAGGRGGAGVGAAGRRRGGRARGGGPGGPWTRRRCAGCWRRCGGCRDRGPAGGAHPARGRAGRLPQGHGRPSGPGAAGAPRRPVRGRGPHLPPQAGRPRESSGLRRDGPGPLQQEARGRAVQLAFTGRRRGPPERRPARDAVGGLTVAPVAAPRDPSPEHRLVNRRAGLFGFRPIE